MKIQQLPITSIKPYWRNPRNNANAIAAVKKSIEQFGFNQPLILDKDGVIIAGHTRYKALLELGHAKVACVTVDLDPQRAKAYRIADNKTSELAEWDLDKLIPELREIDDAELMGDFFDEGELDKLLADSAGLNFESPTQDEIDDTADKLDNQFDSIEASATAEQVEVICPHCGEKSYVPREHLEREMKPKE